MWNPFKIRNRCPKCDAKGGLEFCPYNWCTWRRTNLLKVRERQLTKRKERAVFAATVANPLIALLALVTVWFTVWFSSSPERSMIAGNARKPSLVSSPAGNGSEAVTVKLKAVAVERLVLISPLSESNADHYGELGRLTTEIVGSDRNIVAMAPGTVVSVSRDPDAEHRFSVEIVHRSGYETYYGLLTEVSVQVGDYVERSQPIGKVLTA